MFRRSMLLLSLVAGGLGCKSAHHRSNFPPPTESSGMQADGDVQYADYGYTADYAESAPVMTASEPPMAKERARVAKRLDTRREMASPPPAKAEPEPSASAVTPTDERAEPALEAPEHEVNDRHIIYTANLGLSVFNLEEAMKKAEVLPDSYGGYVHAMSSGHLVMRIPSKHLRRAMDDLAELGVVEQRSLQAQDVTAEFTDIDSRIRVLEETQKQMVELLAKARTVDEALAVRRALDQITMELEVLKGRMRQLQNMIAYSTLTVHLVERGPHVVTPSSRDPFPWVNDLGVEATEWK